MTLTLKQSEALLQAWLTLWPEMQVYRQGVRDPRNPGKFIGRTLTGREKPNMIYTASLNYPFQGLSSDCSKTAVWDQWLLDAPQINLVH